MSKNALVVGLAMFAGAVVSAGAQNTARGQTAAMPKDACALLTVAEVQAMAGAAVKDGITGSVPSLGALSCTYTWGPGNNAATGLYQLSVLATDASKAFPGMSPALVKQAMLARVKLGGIAGPVPDIGEVATFESDDPIRINAKALAKGVLLTVELEGSNARLRREQVILLLKTAVGRL